MFPGHQTGNKGNQQDTQQAIWLVCIYVSGFNVVRTVNCPYNSALTLSGLLCVFEDTQNSWLPLMPFLSPGNICIIHRQLYDRPCAGFGVCKMPSPAIVKSSFSREKARQF